MRLGIIDVGTNSIHLVIVEAGPRGRVAVLRYLRTPIRWGAKALEGRLSFSIQRQALAILRRYAGVLARARVDRVEAVATSAVREARNGYRFVRQVRQTLKIPLRIISGREEARLIYRGVAHDRRGAILLVAIGGGSAQVVLGRGSRVRYTVSLPLGGARLAQQFIRHDPPRAEELEALRRATHRAWTPVARVLRRHRWRAAFGCSSLIHQLMAASSRPRSSACTRRSITQPVLRTLVLRLSEAPAHERRRWPGIDPAREDQVVAAGIALLTFMEACGVAVLRSAAGSLRDGLARRGR